MCAKVCNENLPIVATNALEGSLIIKENFELAFDHIRRPKAKKEILVQ